jgi:hypothetical protein
VETLTPDDLVPVEALPYRRVLSKEGSERLWAELRKIWSIGDGYWFPLKEGPAPSDVLTFHTDYFESINGQALLREALEQRGISRVFLLHEFGDPEYEIELSIYAPSYRDGGEQYSTSEETDCRCTRLMNLRLRFAVNGMPSFFASCTQSARNGPIGGPISTPDPRGTWETVKQCFQTRGSALAPRTELSNLLLAARDCQRDISLRRQL